MSPKYAMPTRGTERVSQEVWAGKIMQRIQRRNSYMLQKTQNALLRGEGSGIAPQDRAAGHTIKQVTSNPIDYPNYFERWREYVRWYRKSWEVRKVIDIIVDDAFRIPFELRGVSDEEGTALMSYWDKFKCEKQFRRCWKQERLLGGSGLFPGVADAPANAVGNERRTVSDPMNLDAISGRRQDAFRCLNLIDVNRISRGDVSYNVFSEDYDQLKGYLIDGTFTDMSRLIIFDAEPLFNRQNLTLLQNWVLNPAGFGDSILGPLFDLLIWETGSQEAAFHLIGLASVLIMSLNDYKGLVSTKSGDRALEQLSRVMEQINIYRAVQMDGTDAKLQQHSATFGSVPDLMMSFLEILCAASDTPITRFLGRQSKNMGGGNEGDLENYYNTVDSAQRLKLRPNMVKVFSIFGVCEFGLDRWIQMKPSFDVFFPPCFQKDDKEQADIAKTWIEAFKPLYDAGMMSVEELSAELKARSIFVTDVQLQDALEEPELGPDGLPLGPGGQAALDQSSGDGEQPPLGPQRDEAGKEVRDTSRRKPSGKTTVLNAWVGSSRDVAKQAKEFKSKYGHESPEVTYKAYRALPKEVKSRVGNVAPDIIVEDLGSSSGIHVYAVDGNEVKKRFDMNFVEGGNDLVYDFIPEATVWIDSHLDESQWPFIIGHELRERQLMSNGMDYDTAHALVNQTEAKERKAADGSTAK